ncbi:MAG: hypothetical protein PVG66_05060 [Chromatiales bacterium]|jgi:WD40 repeat protein
MNSCGGCRPVTVISHGFAGLLLLAFLVGCTEKQYITPDRIVEDAHGGGSLLRAARYEQIVASGGWSGDVKLWRLQDAGLLLKMRHHQGHITGLAFIDRDQALVSTAYDGRIVVTDLSGRVIRGAMTAEPITAMVLSESDDLLITGHKSGDIHLWSLEQLQIRQSLYFNNDRVRALAYEQGSGLLASADADAGVFLWQRQKGLQTRLRLHKDIRTLAFAPDASALYGGSWFDLYRWDLPDMRQHVIATDHAGIIVSMKFDQQGDRLYSISRQTDSVVLALAPLDGRLQKRFFRHSLCGSSLELSAQDRYLVSSSDDASISIWELQSSDDAMVAETAQ